MPNHCSSDHPLFKKALAASPGSAERALFIFRDGRGPDGAEPPNNWPSRFGGRAWTRVPDGQWYLHLFDSSQPDWNWRDPRVGAMFEEILRFWLDRGIGGFRVDVAHGLFKDPQLADVADVTLTNRPSAYYHRPEVHAVYRRWREILDSYPSDGFPGARTAVGEVWADSAATLKAYLADDELPQVFNFDLVQAAWSPSALRAAIESTHAFADGSRAPWVIGNHDVVRPVTRWGVDAARAAALLLLALPGSAYIYQGEELGLPEVEDIPDDARRDPTFRRTGGKEVGRDGCRIPLPWSAAGASFGFSRTDPGSDPAPPWLPQPPGWGALSVAVQSGDPGSFLSLYRAALRLRRQHPALGSGPDGGDAMRWLEAPAARSSSPRPWLPVRGQPRTGSAAPAAVREVLLASGPLPVPPASPTAPCRRTQRPGSALSRAPDLSPGTGKGARPLIGTGTLGGSAAYRPPSKVTGRSHNSPLTTLITARDAVGLGGPLARPGRLPACSVPAFSVCLPA